MCGTEDASRFGRGGHVGSIAGSSSGSSGADLALRLSLIDAPHSRGSEKYDQERRGSQPEGEDNQRHAEPKLFSRSRTNDL